MAGGKIIKMLFLSVCLFRLSILFCCFGPSYGYDTRIVGGDWQNSQMDSGLFKRYIYYQGHGFSFYTSYFLLLASGPGVLGRGQKIDH